MDNVIVKNSFAKASIDGVHYSITYREATVFSFGERTTKEFLNYGTPQQREYIYEYYISLNDNGQGKLKREVDFDGCWVHYSYDSKGRVIKEVRPFMDAIETDSETLCEVTTFDYNVLDNSEQIISDDTRWRTKVITTCGVETHREYALYYSDHETHIVAASPAAAYDNPANRVEKIYFEFYYDYNYEQKSHNTKIEYADGTSLHYTYSDGSHVVYTDGNSFTIHTTTITTVKKYLGNIISRSVITTNTYGTTEYMREYAVHGEKEFLIAGFDTEVDEFGRAIKKTTIDGDKTIYEYLQLPLDGDTSTNPILYQHTRIIAPDGTETIEYYDVWKRKTYEIKNGIKTTYVYDAHDNVIQKIITGRNGGTLVSTSTFSQDGQLISETDECGKTTSYSYETAREIVTDAMGNVTITEYYADKRLKRILLNNIELKTYTYGVENGEIYTKESFSVSEWTKTFINFFGDEYKTVYADNYIRTTIFDQYARISVMQDSVGNTSSYEYDLYTGELCKQIANGVVSVFRNGWRVKRGTTNSFSETLGYFNDNLVVLARKEKSRDEKKSWNLSEGKKSRSIKTYLNSGITKENIFSQDGDVVENIYANDVLIHSTHSLRGSLEYEYDEFDRIKTITQDVGGKEISATGTYDNCGRILSVVYISDGRAKTVTYSYDDKGRRVSETTPGGLTVYYQYNSQDSITQISGGTYLQNYAYDTQNRLIGLTVYKNSETPQTTGFEYDCRGNLSKKIYPDGNYEKYTYRPDGQLSSFQNCRGQIVEYGYDNLSRLISIRGTGIYWDFVYDYRGMMLSAYDGEAMHNFEYNALGFLVSENFSDVPNTQIKYFLDGKMRRVAMSFDGEQTRYLYVGDTDRLASVAKNNLEFTYNRLRGTDKVLQTVATKAGEYIHSLNRTFNSFGELISIGEYIYSLDADSKRLSAGFPDGSWRYQYDGKNQISSGILTGENGMILSQCSYAYDDMGNRISASFSRDADGNSLNIGDCTCTYDSLNRLSTITSDGITYQLKYDYGSRIYKIETWQGENFISCRRLIYDKWNVIAEYVDGIKEKTYLWGEDIGGALDGAGGVGGLLAETNNAGTFLPVYDGNGNIVKYLSLSRESVAEYVYDPFGNIVLSRGNMKDEFAYRFSTKREINGLYYYGFRFYDPVNGVWTSRDPIGENGGVNLHAFVGNDGINNFDLLGLDWFKQCCNGREINTWNQCCCTNGVVGENKQGGVPLDKKEVFTGVEYYVDRSRWYYISYIIRPDSPSQFMLQHAWLRKGEKRFGAYPEKRSSGDMFLGYFGKDSKGRIEREQQEYIEKEGKLFNLTFNKKIRLSPCKYNITQFNACIDSNLKEAEFNWNGWNNCLDWVYDTIALCKRKSKGCGE